MERYKNLGGGSSIIGYESGQDFIRVQFSDNSIYLYTYASTGSHYIEKMKHLASDGQGLNSFIGTTVRKKFARKES